MNWDGYDFLGIGIMILIFVGILKAIGWIFY